MKYFKIRVNYGDVDDKYISIDEDELETALFCFMSESKGVFKNGVCRGKDIISITEDWNKAMGWNAGYNLGEEDWADLRKKGMLVDYAGVLGFYKRRVEFLVTNGRTDLIGKNIDIPEVKLIENPDIDTRKLSEKMRIK